MLQDGMTFATSFEGSEATSKQKGLDPLSGARNAHTVWPELEALNLQNLVRDSFTPRSKPADYEKKEGTVMASRCNAPFEIQTMRRK